MWWSVWARKPAYTSAIRANRRLSSSLSESQGLVKSSSGNGWPSGPDLVSGVPIGLTGGSSVPGGARPLSLLRGESLLAPRLVPHVELAAELLDPVSWHVVRCVAGAGGVVQEERLVRGDHLGVLDELERLVGDVVGQVITLLRGARLADRVVVVDQVRVPLVGLRAEEPVAPRDTAA